MSCRHDGARGIKEFFNHAWISAIEQTVAMTGMNRCADERWSHFLRQPAKVDLPMQRTIHHEDAETVFG